MARLAKQLIPIVVSPRVVNFPESQMHNDMFTANRLILIELFGFSACQLSKQRFFFLGGQACELTAAV